MYDSVIFDLDGTLWDTCESCAISWNNVITKYNIKFRKIVSDDVRIVAGRSHEQCIRETFIGLAEEEIQILITETAIEDNLMVEKFGGSLYPYVGDGIRKLHNQFPLFIVSNCQEGYIEIFLKYSNTKNYFKDFESWGRSGNSKHQNIIDIMRRNNLFKPVYIGDTNGDKVAAEKAGIDFIYVDYGFGKLEYEITYKNFKTLVSDLSNS